MSVLGVDLSAWEAGKLFCRSGLVTIDHQILTINRVLDGGSASIVYIMTIDRS